VLKHKISFLYDIDGDFNSILLAVNEFWAKKAG